MAIEDRTKIGDVAERAGLRRLHILAWRDLDDVEAGGSEVHADRIATRWAEAGLDVLLRTSRAHGQVTDARRNGYRVIRRAGRHSVFLDAPLQELTRRNGRRDGLLEVWNGLPFFAPLWARGPRATFVHHVHADMWRQVMTPGLARLGEALEVRIAPRCYQRTRVVTPSPSSRRQIIDRLGIPAAQVTTVPNGVDDRFRPGGSRAPHPRIAFVGRLVAHKRVDDLILAAAAARTSVPDLALDIAGQGYERPRLERLVTDLEAEGWVRFLGHVSDDDLVDVYRTAWVAASASTDEGWGLSLTEAAACGTPAVATRIAGHVDSVQDGVSGLLASSVEELGGALTRVLGDAALRARLSEGARRTAEALTWDRTALGVLQAVAGLPVA
ncbi:MAG: glycosyltransferase family 4 protein [Acidimicrobiales bacterium]